MNPNYWTRRQLSRRRFVAGTAASAASLAALAAVGCGDDDDDDGGAAGTTAPGGPAATATPRPKDFLSSIPQNPPDDVAEKDWKMGGRFTRITDRPFVFDVVGGGSTSAGPQTILPAYNKLVRYSNRANQKSVIGPDLEGDLAASWEQPDETTIIFTLHPNIKHQNIAPLNGRALTVDDLKYTFNRGATHAKSAFKTDFQRFSAVEDAGGGKVRLKLKEPYGSALPLLTYVPFMVIPPEIGDQTGITTAVGTGPFILDKVTPNVAIEYRKNPDYFKKDALGRARPYFDGYTLNFVADPATRLALAESGRAELCYQQSMPITFDNVEDIARRNPALGFQVNGQVNPFFSVAGHFEKAPWNDVRIRRALNMLMDRETIMRELHKGLSHVGPFIPWPAAFDTEPLPADLGPNYKYDPKEAKALLSAAGINNLEVQLDWYVSGTNEEILTVFQQSAAEAGVKITLNKSPDISAHTAKQTSGNWADLILLAKSANYNDAQATQSYLETGHSQNRTKTADPELDKLYVTLNLKQGAERRVATKAIWDRHIDQIYEVMLPQKYDLMYWNTRVHNWRNTAMNGNVGHGEGGMDQVWVS